MEDGLTHTSLPSLGGGEVGEVCVGTLIAISSNSFASTFYEKVAQV